VVLTVDSANSMEYLTRLDTISIAVRPSRKIPSFRVVRGRHSGGSAGPRTSDSSGNASHSLPTVSIPVTKQIP